MGGTRAPCSTRSWSLLALLLCACGSEDDFDWCAEAQDPEAIRATGSLSIDYDGFFATGPVSITPYIRNDLPSVVIAKGCGTDKSGTLWRLFGGWLVPTGTGLPAELQADDEAGASFSSEIIVCKDAECLDGKRARILTQAIYGSGTVQSFDPATGVLVSEVLLTNGLQEEIRIEADLHWEPVAP